MWMNIVKALPRKEDIENYLLDDKGVDVIEGMAKLPDKKGLKNAVDRTKELSQGKGVNPDYTTEQQAKIRQNAKKLYDVLSIILEEYRQDLQLSLIHI